MRRKVDGPDAVVARIAARQHGVASLQQLVYAGLSPSAVQRRARAGRLHRVYRGVYAVGHPRLSDEGRWMAAVLACGEGAVLSHTSAAALWGISPKCPPVVDVTVPSYNGRIERPGIRLHRTVRLGPRDSTRRNVIPVTSHARTLRDLGYGPEPSRSDLEREFLALCRRGGLPAPEVNVPLGPFVVDFLWRGAGLIVETDSYRFHSSRAVFESDRARDRELRRRGFVVLRFTYREVMDKPATVVAALNAHLRTPPAH